MNGMSDNGMSEIEGELKRVIVESLVLDGVVPEEIDSDAALVGGGLGLDSIDALELAIEIGRRYGVRIKSDDEKNREIFRSVRTLAAFIVEQKNLGQSAP
jgi:acyl carrier protein